MVRDVECVEHKDRPGAQQKQGTCLSIPLQLQPLQQELFPLHSYHAKMSLTAQPLGIAKLMLWHCAAADSVLALTWISVHEQILVGLI